MNEVVQFGIPERPPWARNWYERLQIRFHKTPNHMRATLAREEQLLNKSRSILDLVKAIHPDCGVQVYWQEKEVKIMHGEECMGVVPFDSLLSPTASTKLIADHVLTCINAKKPSVTT
jgi:hypothetical protein